MIALLLRRHLANLAILPFAFAGAFMVVVLPNELVPLSLLFLTLLAGLVVPQRADAFELSLPIRGREVVLGRALSALAFALLPVAIWVVVAAARGDRGVVGLQVASALLAALAVLAPQVLARGAPRSGIDWSRLGAWAALALASTVWLVAPTLATVAGALGVVTAFVVLWTTVPDALQLASAHLGSSAEDMPPTRASARPVLVRSSRETPTSGREAVGRSERWLALAGSIVSWNVTAFWVIVLVTSVVASGSGFFLLWVAVLNISLVVRMRTRWLATLPLSHRARLLAIVVPALVVTTGCMAIGTLINHSTFYYGGGISTDAPMRVDDGYWSQTTVSIDHWRRAPTGTAPVIVAPWGERVVADTATVFGVTLYNPWTTAKGSSPRFEKAQFERVTTELYGRPLTVEQYRASYPWSPRLDRGFRSWVVKGSFILTLGLVMMLVLEVGYSHRIRPGSPGVFVAQWGCACLALALMAADAAYRVRGGDVVFLLMRRGLLELGSRLPSNPVLAVVVASIPVVAAYALLERQFRRSEPALVARAPSR